MKRALLISFVTTLCVVACGEKSSMVLKGRAKTGDATTTVDTNTKVDESFIALKDADNRQLKPLEKTLRNVLISDDSSQISVLCASDLTTVGKEIERVKILSGSQVMMAQDSELEIPETAEQLGEKEAAPAKEILNVLCTGTPASTAELEKLENLTVLTLPAGETTDVVGKFNVSNDQTEKITLACGDKEQLTNAMDALYPESGSFPVKMLLGLKSKMLFETASKSKKTKEFILVNCEAPTATAVPSPSPATAATSTVDTATITER